MLEPQYLATLRIIHAHLGERDLNWALTGSCSFALQGVPVEVHDIDHVCYVEVEQMRLPVLDLAYEASAYLTLGRRDRAALLRQWLIANSAPGSDPPAEASD